MNDLYDAADRQDELDDQAAGYNIFENNEGLERTGRGDDEDDPEEDGHDEPESLETEKNGGQDEADEEEDGRHDEL